jgi:hypothetical protein
MGSVLHVSRVFWYRVTMTRSRTGAIAAAFWCFWLNAAHASDLPVNPQVTQETIAATICNPGWTRTIRPLVPTMRTIKRKMLSAIGEPFERRNRYALDHKIPLVLGGDPIDRRNLALQPIEESREKDVVEVCLAQMVCAGAMTLEEAQTNIWADWRSAGAECR